MSDGLADLAGRESDGANLWRAWVCLAGSDVMDDSPSSGIGMCQGGDVVTLMRHYSG